MLFAIRHGAATHLRVKNFVSTEEKNRGVGKDNQDAGNTRQRAVALGLVLVNGAALSRALTDEPKHRAR